MLKPFWSSQVLAGLAAFFVATISAPTSSADKKEVPQVKTVSPKAVVCGQATTITIRGLKIDLASEIRFPDATPPIEASIKTKGKAALPQRQEARVVGDTQVEVELKLPAELPPGVISFVVVTAEGESAPHTLTVLDPQKVIVEKEPNDGFSQAQQIDSGKTVVGSIHQPQNVDVFKFAGKVGQNIIIEVQAARFGSGLDALLTLSNDRGQILAIMDDRPDDVDAVIELTLPADGVFFVSLIDAHDQGGPAHSYLLQLR